MCGGLGPDVDSQTMIPPKSSHPLSANVASHIPIVEASNNEHGHTDDEDNEIIEDGSDQDLEIHELNMLEAYSDSQPEGEQHYMTTHCRTLLIILIQYPLLGIHIHLRFVKPSQDSLNHHRMSMMNIPESRKISSMPSICYLFPSITPCGLHFSVLFEII